MARESAAGGCNLGGEGLASGKEKCPTTGPLDFLQGLVGGREHAFYNPKGRPLSPQPKRDKGTSSSAVNSNSQGFTGKAFADERTLKARPLFARFRPREGTKVKEEKGLGTPMLVEKKYPTNSTVRPITQQGRVCKQKGKAARPKEVQLFPDLLKKIAQSRSEGEKELGYKKGNEAAILGISNTENKINHTGCEDRHTTLREKKEGRKTVGKGKGKSLNLKLSSAARMNDPLRSREGRQNMVRLGRVKKRRH